MSSKLLTEAQFFLLARGPYFAVVPLYSPKGEYITAVRKLALNYPLKAAEELRTETSQVFKCACRLRPNISKKEARVLRELRQDLSRVFLTADMGENRGVRQRGLH